MGHVYKDAREALLMPVEVGLKQAYDTKGLERVHEDDSFSVREEMSSTCRSDLMKAFGDLNIFRTSAAIPGTYASCRHWLSGEVAYWSAVERYGSTGPS
jgi:hypothetical protein